VLDCATREHCGVSRFSHVTLSTVVPATGFWAGSPGSPRKHGQAAAQHRGVEIEPVTRLALYGTAKNANSLAKEAGLVAAPRPIRAMRPRAASLALMH
jgi:hypothetical protein